MSTNIVHTNVHGLMFDFAEALNALVPTLKRTKILNERLYGEDGWDIISESLFRTLVEDPILWSIDEAEMGKFKLLKYGHVDCDTKNESYIRIAFKNSPDNFYVFGGFTTSNGEFYNQVVIQEILESGIGKITKCNLNEIVFSCAFFNGNQYKIIEKVTIHN